MSSFDPEVARKETSLPGAFPSERAVVRDSSAPVPPVTAAGTNTTTGVLTRQQEAEAEANAPDLAEEAKELAAEAVTAATALGIAAKDAAVAAKDAALPVIEDLSDKAWAAAGYTKEHAADAAEVARENAATAAVTAQNTAANAAVNARDSAANAAAVARDSAANAAVTARDTAASVANSARENAPVSLLGGGNNTNTVGTSDETSSGVPAEVRDSIIKSGQPPEAAADRQAVQEKHRVEDELLANIRPTQAGSGEGTQHEIESNQRGIQGYGATSGSLSAAHRPNLYSQDTGSYQGSGTAVVLGTGTERAFPLGAQHQPEFTSTTHNQEAPVVTTGLETRETPQISTGTGREVGSGHNNYSQSFAEDVGSGFASTSERAPSKYADKLQNPVPIRQYTEPPEPTGAYVPYTEGEELRPSGESYREFGTGAERGNRADQIHNEVPVRETEETTVGNGPGTYKKLSSGTPSGLQ